MRAGRAVRKRRDSHHKKDDQQNELQHEHRDAHARRRLDAEIIHQRADKHHRHHPHRLGHDGYRRLDRDRDDDEDQRRQQEIVEQHRPAGEEAGGRPNAASGIRVNRAGDGKGAAHRHVAEGGEHHCDETDEIDERHHPLAGIEHDAKHRDRRARHNEDKSVDEKVEEAEGALELLLVSEGFDAFSLHFAPASPARSRACSTWRLSRAPLHPACTSPAPSDCR